MRTTSGRVSRATTTASAPFGGLPDDLDVVLDAEHEGEAGADQRVVVDEEHAQRRAGAAAPSEASVTTRSAGRGARSGRRRAARPLAHG